MEKGLWTIGIALVLIAGCSGTKEGTTSLTLDEARQSVVELEREAANKPDDVKLLYRLAQTHAALGKFDAALTELDRIAVIDSHFANAYLLRAAIYDSLGDPKSKLQTFLDILNLPHGHNYTDEIAGLIGTPFESRALSLGPGNNLYCRYSPDGTRLVWQSDRDGDWNIYLANANGSAVQALTLAKGHDENPVFSPDGRSIVFTSTRDEIEIKRPGDENRELYLAMLASREERRLTKNKADDWYPTFYPDSSTIVYVSEPESSIDRPFIERRSRLMRLAEHAQQPEVLLETDSDNTSPTALPDGRLAWIRIDSTGYTILAGVPGAPPRVLFQSRFPLSGLVAAPDGQLLAFFMKVRGNTDIYLYYMLTGELQRLTAAASEELYPAFSPDGRQLAYSSNRYGKFNIFVFNLHTPISLASLKTEVKNLIRELERKSASE